MCASAVYSPWTVVRRAIVTLVLMAMVGLGGSRVTLDLHEPGEEGMGDAPGDVLGDGGSLACSVK